MTVGAALPGGARPHRHARRALPDAVARLLGAGGHGLAARHAAGARRRRLAALPLRRGAPPRAAGPPRAGPCCPASRSEGGGPGACCRSCRGGSRTRAASPAPAASPHRSPLQRAPEGRPVRRGSGRGCRRRRWRAGLRALGRRVCRDGRGRRWAGQVGRVTGKHAKKAFVGSLLLTRHRLRRAICTQQSRSTRFIAPGFCPGFAARFPFGSQQGRFLNPPSLPPSADSELGRSAECGNGTEGGRGGRLPQPSIDSD